MNPDNQNVFESSGDEDMNQYSVMRKNENHIGFGSKVNNTPTDTIPNEEKADSNHISEEEPLKASPKKNHVKFEDPTTTQEEKEPRKSKHTPRFSKRPTHFHSMFYF